LVFFSRFFYWFSYNIILRYWVIGFWALWFFSLFPLCGVIPISYPMLRGSRVFFNIFLNWFYFNFAIDYLVCLRFNLHYFIHFFPYGVIQVSRPGYRVGMLASYLRVDLRCFIQFFMCEVILVSQSGHKVDILARCSFFLFFLKIDFFSSSSFEVSLVIKLWISFIFLFIIFLSYYPILIQFFSLSLNNVVEIFKKYFFIILTSVHFPD
jgi:hypothetical protein